MCVAGILRRIARVAFQQRCRARKAILREEVGVSRPVLNFSPPLAKMGTRMGSLVFFLAEVLRRPTMNSEKSLKIQSRPDRIGLWVRFRHPISHASLRVDLGHDRQEAETICEDLNTILGAPTIREDRHHPDFDGLHEQALNAFFGEVERFQSRIKAKIEETNN